MPVRTDERQYRAMVQFRAGALAWEDKPKRFADSEYEVQGYATTFSKPYAMWGEYKEQISPNVLDDADMSDVIMQYDHQGKVLARMTNRTLIMEADANGIFVAADLSRSEAARQLYEEINAGLITKMSWAFSVLEESFNTDLKLWTVEKVKKVFDVSAVSIPANDATEISARACVDGAIEAERRSDRARKVQVLKVLTRI
jgi:HK97 family phage prohead protease